MTLLSGTSISRGLKKTRYIFEKDISTATFFFGGGGRTVNIKPLCNGLFFCPEGGRCGEIQLDVFCYPIVLILARDAVPWVLEAFHARFPVLVKS